MFTYQPNTVRNDVQTHFNYQAKG